MIKVQTGMLKKVDKGWGLEEWWVNNENYCFKILVLKPGFMSSIHYHPKKTETFLVLKGTCYLRVWEGKEIQTIELQEEQQVTIERGTPHQFYLPEDFGVLTPPTVVYELSQHHSEDDVVRRSESGPLLGVLP